MRESASTRRGRGRRREQNAILHLCEELEPRRLLTVEPISLADFSPLATAAGRSDTPTVSKDGRYIAYTSDANNIVPGQDDRNSTLDVFLYDRVARTSQLVSHAAPSALTTGVYAAFGPTISADGRYIAYFSQSPDLVAGEIKNNGSSGVDAFLYDRITGTNTLVSHAASNPLRTGGQSCEETLAINADGRYIAFVSASTDLMPGQVDANGFKRDVFLWDRLTNSVALVSHAAGSFTTTADNHSAYDPQFSVSSVVISGDGAYVAYFSYAGNIVAGQTDQTGGLSPNAFVYERGTGINTLATHAPGNQTVGTEGVRSISSISVDGRYVAFEAGAFLVPGETAGAGLQAYVYDRVTNANALASHSTASPTQEGNDSSAPTAMSDDGRYVTIFSYANNLVAGQTGSGSGQVFLYDRVSNTNVLVSHTLAGRSAGGNGAAGQPVLSADGRYVAFVDEGGDLIGGPFGTQRKLYLFDRSTGSVTLVSHQSVAAALPSAGACNDPVISGDGAVVAYQTLGTDLVGGLVDANVQTDVLLYDRSSDLNVAVSTRAVDSLPYTGNGGSSSGGVSSDGRFVVFASSSTNLVAGQSDVNNTSDVFLLDRQTRQTTLVSHKFGSPSTAGASGFSGSPVISADGSYVAFVSGARDLTATPRPPASNALHLYLYDRASGQMVLISHKAADPNSVAGGSVSFAAVSADGRFITYESAATDLVASQADNNGDNDIFLYDRTTGMNILVSHAAGIPTAAANKPSLNPSISSDGRFVAYQSGATDLIVGQTTPAGSTANIFLYDRTTGLTALVTHSAAATTTAANARSDAGPAAGPSALRLSADGRYLLYASNATDLVSGQTDANNAGDLFLYDSITNSSVLVSHTASSGTTAGSGGTSTTASDVMDLSADGRYVTYVSAATNLVAGQTDTNSGLDVFLYDRVTGGNKLVSHVPGQPAQAGKYVASGGVAISADGAYVGYVDDAATLSAAPLFPQGATLLLYDRSGDASEFASHSYFDASIAAGVTFPAQRLSGDGSIMVFSLNTPGLIPGDWNFASDVFAFVRTAPLGVIAAFSYALAPHALKLTFTRNVSASLSTSDLQLTNLTQNVVVPPERMNLAYTASGNTATFTFPDYPHGLLPDGRYRAILPAGAAADGAGHPLSDNFVFEFFVQAADANHDALVDNADVAVLLGHLGGGTRTAATGDFNGDGKVTFADFQVLELAYGKSVPPAFSAPATTPVASKSSLAKPAPVSKPLPVGRPPSPFLVGSSKRRNELLMD